MQSQYPADSTEQHVEYILVASFDIDRGSVMEHQYPGAISGDENMLAELMLPDQAHARKEDWTIFFLHKDTGEEAGSPQNEGQEQDGEGKGDLEKKADGGEALEDGGGDADAAGQTAYAHGEEQDEEPEGGEGPPLIYVLNLVNTKYDASAKR